jgi:uncharacterized SAM-binding protein YcdF (DUF218 family)
MFTRLIQRRTVWWPTPAGWAGLAMLIGAPSLLWWLQGEAFFSLTERQPAEVLVVEGWIGIDGVTAAKQEFEQGGYLYIVTAGGPTSNRWGRQQWNYAIEAAELLVRLGVPAEKVIVAPAPGTSSNRTFESALVVRQTMDKRGLHPAGVNVMTIGAHARRSRLVFAKVLPRETGVGSISWVPADYRRPGPWWKSSERALDLIKETVGYLFEVLLNSGRISNTVETEKR